MTNPPPFNEQEREDLVAYLDGELPGEAARALERKLALDPRARAEADALRRAWDLLDFQPRPDPSPSFTHRMLRHVTVSRAGPRRWRPWALGLGWAASVALALSAAYTGGRALKPRGPADQDLVRDLRVIENKRLYELADDVDFLRELDRPELFGEDGPGT